MYTIIDFSTFHIGTAPKMNNYALCGKENDMIYALVLYINLVTLENLNKSVVTKINNGTIFTLALF